MNKLILVLALVISIGSLFAQVKDHSEYPGSMKKVILIDTVATEVILNKNGDILAIIRTIPDYFDNNKFAEEITMGVEIADISSGDIITAERDAQKASRHSNPLINFEISFKSKTAYIDPLQIAYLDHIIADLNSGRIDKVRLFSFVNEPYHLARLLVERRLEAVTTYMKIKGIDVDSRVIIENAVEGKSNKIVFIDSN